MWIFGQVAFEGFLVCFEQAAPGSPVKPLEGSCLFLRLSQALAWPHVGADSLSSLLGYHQGRHQLP